MSDNDTDAAEPYQGIRAASSSIFIAVWPLYLQGCLWIVLALVLFFDAAAIRPTLQWLNSLVGELDRVVVPNFTAAAVTLFALVIVPLAFGIGAIAIIRHLGSMFHGALVGRGPRARQWLLRRPRTNWLQRLGVKVLEVLDPVTPGDDELVLAASQEFVLRVPPHRETLMLNLGLAWETSQTLLEHLDPVAAARIIAEWDRRIRHHFSGLPGLLLALALLLRAGLGLGRREAALWLFLAGAVYVALWLRGYAELQVGLVRTMRARLLLVIGQHN